MCVICSFKFCHIAALLVNAVIFPGITTSLRGPVISSINELLGCVGRA